MCARFSDRDSSNGEWSDIEDSAADGSSPYYNSSDQTDSSVGSDLPIHTDLTRLRERQLEQTNLQPLETLCLQFVSKNVKYYKKMEHPFESLRK